MLKWRSLKGNHMEPGQSQHPSQVQCGDPKAQKTLRKEMCPCRAHTGRVTTWYGSLKYEDIHWKLRKMLEMLSLKPQISWLCTSPETPVSLSVWFPLVC